MAGASVQLAWDAGDLARINKVFDRLIKETDDLTPLFQDIGEYLLPAHEDRIEREISPDGTPFQPLSPDYLASKKKRESRGADRILVLNNFLAGLLSYTADRDGLELGTNTIYGATQQFGRGPIPPRPFLGFSDDDVDEIGAIAEDFLDDLLTQ